MKYGQEYKAALASDEFPTHWVSAALSYRNLKKCIKQVQQELEDLGLDAETLKSLNSPSELLKGADDAENDSWSGEFVPELWVAVDGETGQFLHAGLTNSTRKYLNRRSLTRGKPLATFLNNGPDSPEDPPAIDLSTHSSSPVLWKQIPLSAATTFFESLDPALKGLEDIQASETDRLQKQITLLGSSIANVTDAESQRKSKLRKMTVKDKDIWRQLFAAYLEEPIFFSTYEQDHGSRTYDQAKSQLERFSDTLVKAQLASKFSNPQSKTAFDAFININLDILRIMHFEHIISVAVRKILKKFDKRTALSASDLYHPSYGSGPLAKSIAQDMCGEISTKIVSIVPQLDDYLCPICCELAWKPVRLGCCNAVFCIRCIVVLQRQITLHRSSDPKCPMCRSNTVMGADASRIDDQTIRYLQKHFPNQVKAKQAMNERAAGVDRYGENFYKTSCTVM